MPVGGFRYRIHSINEDIFDHLNKESSYLLGLLTADGYNAILSHQYHFRLFSIDYELLELANTLLGSATPIKKRKGGFFVAWCSKKLCTRLAELGMLPKQARSFCADSSLKLSHYMRGLVDGDGTI